MSGPVEDAVPGGRAEPDPDRTDPEPPARGEGGHEGGGPGWTADHAPTTGRTTGDTRSAGGEGWTAAAARTAVRTEGDPSEPASGSDQDRAGSDHSRRRHGRHGKKAKPPRSALRNLLEWGGVIIGAIAVAFVVKTFLFQAFWIPSPSMSPTLVKGDRVLVNKLSYRLHDVNRGDVIVFERPETEDASQIKDLIKRVVAISGDRVSIRDGKVFRNGQPLDEPYVHGLPTTYSSCGLGDVKGIDSQEGLRIPAGEVFVMGDNRVNSHDGRCFGPIDEDLIVGRAFFIIWPPSKIGGL